MPPKPKKGKGKKKKKDGMFLFKCVVIDNNKIYYRCLVKDIFCEGQLDFGKISFSLFVACQLILSILMIDKDELSIEDKYKKTLFEIESLKEHLGM